MLPNLIEIGQLVVEISQVYHISRWRPSAILDLFRRIWTTHIGYLVVFITVQNLFVMQYSFDNMKV